MNLVAVMDEIFDVLAAADIALIVPGERDRGGHGRPPNPYVELPEIVYSSAGPGLDRIPDFSLMVVFGQADNSQVFRMALEYASTTGTKSIKAALEAHEWVSCHTLFVLRAEPDLDVTVQGGNPQLAYTFHIDITGAP